MEHSPEKPTTGAVSNEKETLKYDFAPEAYLMPRGAEGVSELNPENKIEGLDVRAQYEEMIGEVFTEKVLRPNMSDEEIDRFAAERIAEYEAPIAEKAAEEDLVFMEHEAETNKKEITTAQENNMSPMSRAIELIGEYLSKHKKTAQAAMGLVLASELSGCATGGGGYYAGQAVSTGIYGAQRETQTIHYGRQHQQQTEAYGTQHANSQARYAVRHAQSRYGEAMRREDLYYRQSLARPLGAQQRAEIDSRHHTNIENIKAQYNEQMIAAQQNYHDNMEQTHIRAENIRMNTEIQRQNIQMNTNTQITNQIIQGFIQEIIRR
jgi:hypothetical protein